MVKAKATNKQAGRFGKIYREFTRVKFNKYKQQFPKIRESELIAKILREWEAMDEEAKVDLEKRFVERSGKDFLDDPSSSDKKSKEKKEAEEKNKSSSDPEKTKKIGKTKKPSPKARVFVEKEISDPSSSRRFSDPEKKSSPSFQKTSSAPTVKLSKSRKSSENSKSPGKKSTPEKKDTSSSQIGLTDAQKKGDVKAQKEKRNVEFLNFFKYYHERLTSEHPRWSTAQITTIIKLLWRKRNKGGRRKSIKLQGLTGRQLYNRTKIQEGFLKEQIKQLWRALPHESKKYWQIRGQGKPNRSKKDSGRFVRKVLNAGVTQQVQTDTAQSNTYNWMNQLIK